MNKLFTGLSFLLLISCTTPTPSSIEGTWELLSETKIEKGDTTFTEASKLIPMIKIINNSHFTFLRHDLQKGKDSTAMFSAGGGRYELKDGQYTEYLEYCSAREWENNTFHFTVSVDGDMLNQQGQEKVEGTDIDRVIIEKYRRVR
ncbi:MAG TPA: hypothetical protein VK508_05765 [Cyclobacteriaceae bacterium]|nr:hypothetical protein [Cyclobacteriaceae bacterium]